MIDSRTKTGRSAIQKAQALVQPLADAESRKRCERIMAEPRLADILKQKAEKV